MIKRNLIIPIRKATNIIKEPQVAPFTLIENTGKSQNIAELFLCICAVCSISHFVYFLLAPLIWSLNLKFDPQVYTPWFAIAAQEHDGMELYALYALMFICLASSLALIKLLTQIKTKMTYCIFVSILALLSCRYILTIGLHLPMNTLAERGVPLMITQSLQAIIILVPIVSFMFLLMKLTKNWLVDLAVLVLLLPVCFISTQPISWSDYSFIFAPALRLMHGAKLSEIYFQYDLLLSLIAFIWVKMHLDLNLFQVVGQTSYFLFIFSVFLFSKKFYFDKKLSIFLLITLVLVRMYASLIDPVFCFQVTPLRLDWWLVLLVLVYSFGPYHWSAGLFCVIMIMLHKNFGIIYTLAYLEFLFCLFLLEMYQAKVKTIKALWVVLTQTTRKIYLNLVMIASSGCASVLLLSGPYSDSVYLYQKIGIGFIKITTYSFYWYVPIVICLVFILSIILLETLPRKYLNTCLLLIFLVIGNSIYFFGRSHENNILNISGSLLFLFFLLLDMVQFMPSNGLVNPALQFLRQKLSLVISILFVILIIVSYSDKIYSKVVLQTQNASTVQLLYPSLLSANDKTIESYLDMFLVITGGSDKVYFACFFDVIFNYYGDYAPVGYFNPYASWIFKKDLQRFIQDLLDKGYYIVVDNNSPPGLVFNKMRTVGNFGVIWK